MQRLIVVALMETVPSLEDSGRMGKKIGRRLHPYIRAHLSEHAAACGVLADLVADPLFLLSADPDLLMLDVIRTMFRPKLSTSINAHFTIKELIAELFGILK